MHISAETFKQWRDEGRKYQLIDIREAYEIDTCHIDGLPIAMADIMNQLDKIAQEDVVIHCNSGKRSDAVVFALRKKLNRENIYSLEGGLQDYVRQYHPELNCAS